LKRKVIIISGIGAIFAIPLVISSYWAHVFIISCYYAILSSSWSLLAGYAGQFTFAHVALAGIAAYSSGLLGKYFGLPILLTISIGILFSVIVGSLIAILCLRLKAVYLALFTLAFSIIVKTVIEAEWRITDGFRGLKVEKLIPTGDDKLIYCYIMLGILVLSVLLMYFLTKSKLGLFFRAIRENELVASAMAVNVVRYKIIAFIVSSFFAAVAGVFYSHYVGVLTPHMLDLTKMGLVIAMVVIGGIENLLAAALGAMVVQVGLELLRSFGAWRLVLFGSLLIVTLRFARNGLIEGLSGKLFFKKYQF
jgi:branched-chain amino acid transport system permease protein